MADEPADLVDEAWRQIRHALDTGILVTRDGTPLPLSAGEYAQLVRSVAALAAKVKRTGGIPIPYVPPVTSQHS